MADREAGRGRGRPPYGDRRGRPAIILCLVLLAVTQASAGAWNQGALAFEANRGQAAAPVRFLARAAGQTVFLTPDGVTFSLFGPKSPASLRLDLLGARTNVALIAADALPGRVHYFRGRDPGRWQTDIPTWSRVRASGVYHGIDVVYYGQAGRLEYDFVVAPGADPHAIRLSLAGAGRLTLDETGDLLIDTPAGRLRQHHPIAWQDSIAGRVPVTADYAIDDDGTVRLALGDYDAGRELTIDPVIRFSTFLGGSGLEEAHAVATGSDGTIYVAGVTASADFPTVAGAYQPAYNADGFPSDAFVTRLSADGTTVLSSTFLGGTDTDVARGLALDAGGNIYVAGETQSSNFPTTFGALQVFNASIGSFPDGFVTKLSPDGASLVYSTYVGGSFTDTISGIAVDSAGSAYVTGFSDSTLRTAGGPFQTFCQGTGFGGFVSKLTPNGSAYMYATRLCGSANDEPQAIAVDGAGHAYVGGVTLSPDFPVTPGAFRTSGGGDQEDGFVARLATDGSSLDYSTYLGGSDADTVRGIAVTAGGQAVVTGFTYSPDFPVTPGAFAGQQADGGAFTDAFVTMLDASGSALAWSTFLGGSGEDQGLGVAVGANGAVHVAGVTGSADFPASGAACQTGFGGASDAFVARIAEGGASLDYSFFLGGRDSDTGSAVAVGPNGGSVIAGQTWSTGFPTTAGAFRGSLAGGYAGGSDAFVARVDDGAAPAPPCISLSGLVNGASFAPGPVSPGEIVSLFGDGLGPDALAIYDVGTGDAFGTELAGTEVFFDGSPAPVISTVRGQVNTIVPYAVAGHETTVVRVRYLGVDTAPLTAPVAASAPAIFTVGSVGRGAGAVQNQDFTLNTPENPAARGSVLQIYATGEGQTNPTGLDGHLATGTLAKPVLPVKVFVGGLEASIDYAGAAPGLVAGLIQINAKVPLEAATGSAIPITISIGDKSSPPGVTVAIQ